MKFTNSCDQYYKSIDIRFTKKCDNNCPYCIEKIGIDSVSSIPNIKNMLESIKTITGVDDILILGGEPFLYIDQLYEFIKGVKKYTNLKIYITTALPKICYNNFDFFSKIMELIDGLNISAHHIDDSIGDISRNSKSIYNRKDFYNMIPYKSKIRINLNLCKNIIDSKESLDVNIKAFDNYNFGSIKINELQNEGNNYVSYEKIMGIKLLSPFSHGCQTILDTNYKTPIILKRSCFLTSKSLNASFMDGVKAIIRPLIKRECHRFVIYEDGTITNQWLKGGK